METVTGKVVRLSVKAKNYSVQLDDGSWYSGWLERNTNQPPKGVEQDANVQFQFEQKGNFKNIKPNSMTVLANQPAASGGDTGGKSYADKDAARQREIRWHSSRNAAIEVLRIAFEQDSVALGTAKKGEKFDAILSLVDDTTRRFYFEAEEVSSDGVSMELPDEVTVDGQ